MIRVAVDAVVFTVMDDELKLLLVKRKNPPYQGKYALPGGFVEEKESLEDAVKRELTEETSVSNIFLKQIEAYGEPKRDPRGRIISVAFLALIAAGHRIKASSDAESTSWFNIDDLPELAFDHDKIIKDALKQLKFEVQTTNIAVEILPQKFTLSQMQRLYEIILGSTLDKRNFRKKIKELEMLKETKEELVGAHRPARLYSFVDKNYTSIKDRVHVFL